MTSSKRHPRVKTRVASSRLSHKIFQANDNGRSILTTEQTVPCSFQTYSVFFSFNIALFATMADYAKRSEVTIQTMVRTTMEDIYGLPWISV